MSTEEPTERCYSEIVTRLDPEERETIAEAAALLASTADRMAQIESDGDAEGMAVELRRIADEQARIEEIALAPCSGTN
ncbi:hypothetical protein SY89_00744 [Halolamina pelagica]|uniref:Uncharacterized protein n=1 Tax=Halolamina pelagica TaxID=699431 RepID=A0A0P7GWW6_9EURY|nr:hypothetical protein [Halolamina pelagica]KPN30022.1 hypothetical protein SY89_00744 [Halolamina pelagica]